MRADIIKNGTIEQIANIPVKQVFEWVKTGVWSCRDFAIYLNAIELVNYSEGYRDSNDFFEENTLNR